MTCVMHPAMQSSRLGPINGAIEKRVRHAKGQEGVATFWSGERNEHARMESRARLGRARVDAPSRRDVDGCDRDFRLGEGVEDGVEGGPDLPLE